MFHITRGRALVTVTELGPRGPGIGVIILAVAVVAISHRYARTLTEALTVSLWVLFALTGAAVVTGVVLLARRIRAELRPARTSAPAVTAAADTTAGQLRTRAAAAIEPGPVVDVKPEWIIPREARP